MSSRFPTLQHFPANFSSRKLLLQLTPSSPPPSTTTHLSPQPYSGNNGFDANVVMVLSVLLCALICSLGLNSIIRCVLRCSNLVSSQSAAGNSSVLLANTGVKRKALKTFPVVTFSIESKLPGLDTDCVICLSEFVSGDRLRLLPKCHHGFHVRCIDRWLSSNSSCPTCRYSLIETCQKIIAGGQSSSRESPPVAEDGIVSIAPLEHEGLVCNYRENSLT